MTPAPQAVLQDDDVRRAAAALRPDRPLDDVIARVAWGVLTEPGDGTAGALVAQCGPLEALQLAFGGDAEEEHHRAVRSGRKRWLPRWDTALIRAAMDAALRCRAQLLLPGDAAWPAGLDDLDGHAPHVLWVRGDAGALGRAHGAVAIVGARAATAYGEHVAADFAGGLTDRGFLVISGGAYGIDGAAHRAVLRAGGDTVAFLAGGVDRAYPAGHAQLLQSIAGTGAVLSEVPCGTAPTKWRFLARNRLIAAAAHATVVVEAGARSGSLNTAGHAASLGRPLGAVPGSITSAASMGCHRLLREYDARCVTSVDDVVELMGLSHGLGEAAQVPPRGPHDAELVRLGDALSARAPREPLDLARRSGLSIERVEALLGLLALEGTVQRGAGGWRRV